MKTDLSKYAAVAVNKLEGGELFTGSDGLSGASVLDFWRWSGSELIGNTMRGVLAEFLVACVCGVSHTPRIEWEPYDIETPEGIRIEVKSAAYLQSWAQKELSRISFSVSSTMKWNRIKGVFEPPKRRWSDVYVFCLLEHQDKATLNPLDVSQWRFYAASTAEMDIMYPSQRRLSLAQVKDICGEGCGFDELKSAIETKSKKGLPKD
jgi:hypothetical protein